MRTALFAIIVIVAISSLSLVLVDNITGNVVNTANCPGGHTYAFYRTLEERTRVEAMWRKAGFLPIASEPVPESFKSTGEPRFLCLRRMTRQEMERDHMRIRESVTTKGSSV
ncbi:hypothetical protein HY489_02365 [Candidatus Woesearchaeota archaeon]|nr:hypothetical protein [Candidatus Woesearchaeota archaeon]